MVINIPVKVNKTTYYISLMDPSTLNASAKTAASYKDTVKIINFSITTISPSDITMKDLKNATQSEATTEGVWLNETSYSVPYLFGPNITSYTVTIYNASKRVIKVTRPRISANDYMNIGVILTTLIKHCHTHSTNKRAVNSSILRASAVATTSKNSINTNLDLKDFF